LFVTESVEVGKQKEGQSTAVDAERIEPRKKGEKQRLALRGVELKRLGIEKILGPPRKGVQSLEERIIVETTDPCGAQ